MNETPLRVLVVDDEPMARARLRRMLGAEYGVHIVGECSNGEEVADAMRASKPELVFMDIRMPGMDGFGALHSTEPAGRPHVVFVTAFPRHALDAFEHGAIDYLLKPYSRERLRIALDRARARRPRGPALPGHGPAARLPVPVGHRLRMVPVASIDCIVAQLNYVELHVGPERLMLRETMAAMEAQLDPRHFARIHRSRIVRIDAVVEVEYLGSGQYLCRLACGTALGSGPAYRERVREAFALRGA